MNSRRTFLAGLGTAVLAPHALPAVPCADDGQYVVGAMSNPRLPGPLADLVLKTWLAVAADGTGFGVLTDRYDPSFSSHLAVSSTVRRGNSYQWEGIVTRSNEPRLLRQRFVLTAEVCGQTALEIVLLGETFGGRGNVTRG